MNMQRFRQVLAYIEAHPEEWNQREWCGSECCFAGHAACFAGVNAKRTTWAGAVADVAQEWLGMSAAQFRWLYAEGRTLDDFRTVARRVYA
jgi:hypothetical protein